MYRVNRMAAGMVGSIQITRGRDVTHIIRKAPTTVTTLVRICTTSVERLVLTTSTS